MSVEMYATHLTSWSPLGLKDCKSGPANQLDESTVHPSLPGVSDVYAALPRQRAGRIEEQASGQSKHQNNHKDSNWKVEKVKQFTIFHNSNLKIDGFNHWCQPRGLVATMIPSATSSMWTMMNHGPSQRALHDSIIIRTSFLKPSFNLGYLGACSDLWSLEYSSPLLSYAGLSQIAFQLLCAFNMRFWFDAHRAGKDCIDIFRDRDSWFGAMIAVNAMTYEQLEAGRKYAEKSCAHFIPLFLSRFWPFQALGGDDSGRSEWILGNSWRSVSISEYQWMQ